MSTCKSKPWTPVPAPGIKHAVGAKARRRRDTQHALTEIGAQSAARRRNDRAPSLEHVIVPTASLNPASRQVRHRDAAQHARIEASLDRFGICRPILIDTNRTIVEGHGIWEAAKAKGIEEIPCLVIDHLSPDELRLLRIALNRLSGTGAWDAEELRLEFEELTVLGEDLIVTGFEMTMAKAGFSNPAISCLRSGSTRPRLNNSIGISAKFNTTRKSCSGHHLPAASSSS